MRVPRRISLLTYLDSRGYLASPSLGMPSLRRHGNRRCRAFITCRGADSDACALGSTRLMLDAFGSTRRVPQRGRPIRIKPAVHSCWIVTARLTSLFATRRRKSPSHSGRRSASSATRFALGWIAMGRILLCTPLRRSALQIGRRVLQGQPLEH